MKNIARGLFIGLVVVASDGNFVIYAGQGHAPFATATNVSTYGTSGYRLVIENDGNIVIYDGDDRVLWDKSNPLVLHYNEGHG